MDMQKVVRLIVLTGIVAEIAGVFLVVVVFFLELSLVLGAIGVVFLVFPSLFFIAGAFRVEEHERIIIQRFGACYRIVGPKKHSGLHWRFPWVDTIRRYVDIRAIDIELFPGDSSIDFQGGGTASLDEIKGYFQISREEPQGDIPERVAERIENSLGGDNEGNDSNNQEENIRKNCYLSEYEIEDWKMAAQDNLERLVRNILNDRRVEDVIKFVRWEELIKGASDFIETIESWGICFKRLTLRDYGWDRSVEQARVNLFEADRELEVEKIRKKIAKHVSEKWAREIAQTHVECKEIILQNGGTKEEAKEVADRGVMRKIASEAGQFKMNDVRPVLEDLDLQGVLSFAEKFTN